MIQFSKINKTYNPGLFKPKVNAVKGLTFHVNEGEVFGLVGPNGAGKSTTIRMLLGLIQPDTGDIFYKGHPLKVSPLRHDVGYLPENPYLYDHLTLLELLDFCGQTSGLCSDLISERGRHLMLSLNLLDAQKRPLRSFSKGMLQRAGICFALLHDPSVVVLDEPMSGLDPIGRKMVFDLVLSLKGEGKTILFCSHILNDVERLCDRIGLLHNGQLIREFAKEEFLPNSGNNIFLQVSDLTDGNKGYLQSIGADTREHPEGFTIAVSNANYHSVNRYLDSHSIPISGCRSEWLSLEDLFNEYISGRGK